MYSLISVKTEHATIQIHTNKSIRFNKQYTVNYFIKQILAKFGFLAILNTCIQQWHMKLIKRDGKDIYNAIIKISILNTCCCFELKEQCHGFHKNIKRHNCLQHW